MKTNLTRMDVIISVSNRFNVSQNTVKKSLDAYFPKGFFPFISMREYNEFVMKFIKENP